MRELSFERDSLHGFYAGGGDPADVLAEAHRRLDAADDPGVFIDLIPLAQAQEAARALPPFDPDRFPLWGLLVGIINDLGAGGNTAHRNPVTDGQALIASQRQSLPNYCAIHQLPAFASPPKAGVTGQRIGDLHTGRQSAGIHNLDGVRK